MSNFSPQIVSKAWNFAHVLRDDGVSYMAYTEQIAAWQRTLKAAHFSGVAHSSDSQQFGRQEPALQN